MEGLIREKRKLIFQKKIITPYVIRDLANLFGNEVRALKDNNAEHPFIVFSVDASDNSSYESQSSEIFREGDILDKKSIIRVSMRFNTTDYSKNIEIQILHISDVGTDNPGTDNYILVSGDNPTWVNGILARFSEILSLTENQTRYKGLAQWIITILLIVINIIYFRLFYPGIKTIENGWINIILTFGPPVICLGYLKKITEYVESIWPDMELQTGPGHLQKPLQKRQKLIWVLVTLLIPITIGIIYDVIKSHF